MQVPKLLEHSIVTLTLDVYGDYIPEGDGGALNTLPGASSTREAS
jgi:integrase